MACFYSAIRYQLLSVTSASYIKCFKQHHNLCKLPCQIRFYMGFQKSSCAKNMSIACVVNALKHYSCVSELEQDEGELTVVVVQRHSRKLCRSV